MNENELLGFCSDARNHHIATLLRSCIMQILLQTPHRLSKLAGDLHSQFRDFQRQQISDRAISSPVNKPGRSNSPNLTGPASSHQQIPDAKKEQAPVKRAVNQHGELSFHPSLTTQGLGIKFPCLMRMSFQGCNVLNQDCHHEGQTSSLTISRCSIKVAEILQNDSTWLLTHTTLQVWAQHGQEM